MIEQPEQPDEDIFEVLESSPIAMGVIAKKQTANNGTGVRYPFDKLDAVGKSFRVQTSKVKWKSLRTVVYQRNAEYRTKEGEQKREFKFILHADGWCEVARIA